LINNLKKGVALINKKSDDKLSIVPRVLMIENRFELLLAIPVLNSKFFKDSLITMP